MNTGKFKSTNLVAGFLLSAMLFARCSGAFPSTVDGSAAAGSSAGSTAISGGAGDGGEAHFSVLLDGKLFSSSGTDQNSNAAFRLKDGENPVFFKLADMNDPSQRMNFEVPARQGSTTFNLATGFNGYINGFVTYLDDGLTVNVTSLSSTRIASTFAATYTVQKGSPATARSTIQVTDGKFDIPFSTSAAMKKFKHAE